MGTYVATIHRQGVRLWGGPSWKPQQRFAHPLVKLIEFSPCENYLVTWSNEPIQVPEGAVQGPQYFSPEDEGNNVAVWDVRTGDLLRTFSTHDGEAPTTKKQMQWPILKWSPDDKFVARCTPGQMISVYDLPNMGLHGKKSMKIEGVIDFEWCPHGEKDKDDAAKDKMTISGGSKISKKARENMLVYWTPEVSNQPARVTLVNFPSREILRQKNLFNVTEVSFPLLALEMLLIKIIILPSVNCIGKIRVTFCVSKSIGTLKPKSQFSVIWRSSAFARKITLSKWLN